MSFERLLPSPDESLTLCTLSLVLTLGFSDAILTALEVGLEDSGRSPLSVYLLFEPELTEAFSDTSEDFTTSGGGRRGGGRRGGGRGGERGGGGRGGRRGGGGRGGERRGGRGGGREGGREGGGRRGGRKEGNDVGGET